jgi:hypothetical protein
VGEIHDHLIKPSWGKNPYADPSSTPGEVGAFEVYVTKDGKGGHPNEIAAFRPGNASSAALVGFRMYLLDAQRGPQGNGTNRDWGWVEAPVVELLDPATGVCVRVCVCVCVCVWARVCV